MGRTDLAEAILNADAESAAVALREVAGDVIDDLERVVPEAARGREQATRRYVGLWRLLEHRLLAAIQDARPDLVIQRDNELVLMDIERGQPAAINAVFDSWALEAPFTRWAGEFGAGLGSALSLVAELREHLPDEQPLWLVNRRSPTGRVEWDELAARRFVRTASTFLASGPPPLPRIAQAFGLNQTELGRLFGVSRQAASQWLEEGPPTGRAGKVNAVARIADVLERNLRAERIPGIVREPAEANGGLTMLEMIERDRHDELLRLVTATFDWATTA